MKAIINGKRYDTENAVLIGSDSGGQGKRDFRWYEESLYKTKRSGAFFLAGEGGPMSRWAQSTGLNSWSSGGGILPLSREAALEWAESALSASEIEEHFSDQIEEA